VLAKGNYCTATQRCCIACEQAICCSSLLARRLNSSLADNRNRHVQVLQSMTPEQRDALTPLKLRYKARDFAKKEVAAQREQFKRCACC
jgi:hypothetical protein